MMNDQGRFLHFSLGVGVLKFGKFTLKSGRTSPYFFNAGLFHSGSAMAQLGQFYALKIIEIGLNPDVLYGHAYKGIPLATHTAEAFWRETDRDVPWAHNRKEVKDHGDGGIIVGASLEGKRVVMPEDVITSGESIGEAVQIVRAQGGILTDVVIALDRQEVGREGVTTSAVQQVMEMYNISVTPIVTFADLVEYLEAQSDMKEHLDAMLAYREQYGV